MFREETRRPECIWCEVLVLLPVQRVDRETLENTRLLASSLGDKLRSGQVAYGMQGKRFSELI